MRCQRCGFEIEPGQTFCSMCGTEQSKALRAPKRKIKSILGVIKVTSNNHLKMWGNFFFLILVVTYISIVNKESRILFSYLSLAFLLFMYITFQCLVPYKNPNASKSKKYKLGMRVSFVLIILLLVLSLFAGTNSLVDLVKGL